MQRLIVLRHYGNSSFISVSYGLFKIKSYGQTGQIIPLLCECEATCDSKLVIPFSILTHEIGWNTAM